MILGRGGFRNAAGPQSGARGGSDVNDSSGIPECENQEKLLTQRPAANTSCPVPRLVLGSDPAATMVKAMPDHVDS